MITKITVENFKGIGEKVEIPLAPLTLFFGKNSAGKSTVFQAMQYFRDVLEHGDSDVFNTTHGGDRVDLGGFQNIAHSRNPSAPTVIEITLKNESDKEVQSLFPNGAWTSSLADTHLLVAEQMIGITTIHYFDEKHQIELWNWMKSLENLIPNSLDLAQHCAQIRAFSRCVLNTQFNTVRIRMECLRGDFDDSAADGALQLRYSVSVDELKIAELLQSSSTFSPLAFDFSHPLCKKAISSISDIEKAIERPIEPKTLSKIFTNNYRKTNLDIAYPNEENIAHLILSDLKELLKPDEKNLLQFLTIFLFGRFALTPLFFAFSRLKTACYLGGLRTIPERFFSPEDADEDEPAHWADGSSAWNNLFKNPERLKFINYKLLQLDLGYSLKMSDPDLDEQRVLHVHDELLDVDLSARDVGLGIAQVIPVVVATINSTSQQLVQVEQPELHLHPAAQCALADTFIAAVVGRLTPPQIVLETHSEHLILRLLRRIREGYASGNPRLRTEDLSVLYFQRGRDGVRVTPLPVTEDGDFDRPWPEGFFEERAEELF